MLGRPRLLPVAPCCLYLWLSGPAPLRPLRLASAEEGAEDLYELLGVAPDASLEDLKRAYRRKSMLVHPDKCAAAEREGCERRFIALSRAYEALADPSSRSAYDRGRRRGGAASGGPQGSDCWGQGYSWDRCCNPGRPAAERAQCWDGWYTEENCCGGGGGPGGGAAWDEVFSRLRRENFDLGSAVRTFAQMAGNDPSLAAAVETLARYAAGHGVNWEHVGHVVGDKLQAKLREGGHAEAADWLHLGREAWRAVSRGDWAGLGKLGEQAAQRLGQERPGEAAGGSPGGGVGGLFGELKKLFRSAEL